MSPRLELDEIVDPFGAKVRIDRDEAGRVREARFDLSALPRVDALLAGQPVAGVPHLIERLCGICPAAHHLAGVRALEALAGVTAVPDAALAARRLLHHGSALEAHAPRLVAGDRDGALALRGLGRAAMRAAGSPGHFPTTAVPGGVRTPVTAESLDGILDATAEVLRSVVRDADRLLSTRGRRPSDGDGGDAATGQQGWAGADVALADDAGRPDLLGSQLVAVAADGSRLLQVRAPQWDATVAEQFSGRTAPRPYLVALGPERGRYRVGPTAQLRIGRLQTPLAAELQAEWLAGSGEAAGARAIMTVHAVEAIAALVAGPMLLGSEVATPVEGFGADAVGVGWVDGPRGLLVHRYATAPDGTLAAAQILTPTAQNEPWLAELLTAATRAEEAGLRMEAAIREADPCLPCSLAPEGGIGLELDDVTGRN